MKIEKVEQKEKTFRQTIETDHIYSVNSKQIVITERRYIPSPYSEVSIEMFTRYDEFDKLSKEEIKALEDILGYPLEEY